MVSSQAATVSAYLKSLPPDRRKLLSAVRSVVKQNLPKGFVETMQYGMIAWVVPLRRYPMTYNGQPLAVAALASQKNHASLYLMGVYANPKLSRWFEAEWKKSGKKLIMGKSCLRFRESDDLALDVVGAVAAKVTPEALMAQHDEVHGSDGTRRRAAQRKKRAPTKGR